jgi:UDP-glucose 4-epimerase
MARAIQFGKRLTLRSVSQTLFRGWIQARAGDPAAIVADAQTIRRILSWTPAYDDIETIVRHVPAWEQG